MIDLPSVTLFCVDCVDAERAVRALDRCTERIRFGAIKFLTNLPDCHSWSRCNERYCRVEIPALNSLLDYSIFMLKRAHEFIETPHVLVVQHDGYVINPESWDHAWLEYDYIGPIFVQDHSEHAMVGSGGFSLRSLALMRAVAQHIPEWDGTPASTLNVQGRLGAYEDGVICHGLRRHLEAAGMKFATPSVAAKFAQGGYPNIANKNPQDRTYYCERPFGMHGGWRNIDRVTGFVSPPPFV